MNEEIRGTDTMQIIEDRGNVALYKFNNQYFVSFKGTDIKPTSFVYLQDITKYKCNLSLPKIKNILTKLNDSLNTTFYEVDKSKIIENKDNISNKQNE